jgi:hypothetical protein
MPKSKPTIAKEPTLADALRLIKQLEQTVTELRADLNALRSDVDDLDGKVTEKEYDGRGGKPYSDE